MTRISKIITAILATQIVVAPAATAEELTQDQVVDTMVGKPITTRSFGVKVNLRFEKNGDLTAKSFIGDYKGKWVRGKGNQICSTFDSGPAKGTQCNTYTKMGPNKYRTSSGTSFVVNQ